MKVLSYICVVAAALVLLIGLGARFIMPLTGEQPGMAGVKPISFLLLVQIFLLLSLNFTLYELIKKK